MKNLRVVFMGTPDFAVPILEELIKNTNVSLVVSQPNKRVGRHQILEDTPIALLAKKNNIKVFQPINIKEDYQAIIDIKPDIIITCAYGQIIPKVLLNLPPLGCINVHASILPALRGGAPLHHAIIDGYSKTGVTIMYMDEAMDTGDIISVKEYSIKDNDTVGTLHDTLSIMGADLLIETLPSIINHTNNRIKQDNNKATYAYNIKRSDERIDFNKSGIEIDRKVRGLNPFPLSNFFLNNEEVKVIEGHFIKINSIVNKIYVDKNSFGIGCLDGIYYIDTLKVSGHKQMNIKDYLNGVDKNNLSKGVIS